MWKLFELNLCLYIAGAEGGDEGGWYQSHPLLQHFPTMCTVINTKYMSQTIQSTIPPSPPHYFLQLLCIYNIININLVKGENKIVYKNRDLEYK